MLDLSKYDLILLDIEGTVTSISFIKDKLFGYIRKNLKNYLNENYEKKETRNDIENIFIQIGEKKEEINWKNKEENVEKIFKIINQWMDEDLKFPPLKQLQGHVIREAFSSRDVVADLYPDVLPVLKRMKNLNKKISIYSSGSVFAQKLLFSHTTQGDVTMFLSDFYDSTLGPKVKSESYLKISNLNNIPPSSILFFTDLINEAEAAKEAGFEVVVVLRKGNIEINENILKNYKNIHSFEELF